jgi:Na+/H+-dicarboxylate symporter
MLLDATSLSDFVYDALLIVVLPSTFVLFIIGIAILKRRNKAELGDILLLFFFSATTAGAFGTLLSVLLSFSQGIFPDKNLSVLVLPSVAGAVAFLLLSLYAYLDLLFDLRKRGIKSPQDNP